MRRGRHEGEGATARRRTRRRRRFVALLAVVALVAAITVARSRRDGGGEQEEGGGSEGTGGAVDESALAFCQGLAGYYAMLASVAAAPVPWDRQALVDQVASLVVPADLAGVYAEPWRAFVAGVRAASTGIPDGSAVQAYPSVLPDLGTECERRAGVDVTVDATTPPDAPPRDEPADGGGLQVVEVGITPLLDPTGDPMISYGFIVQNTSGDVATDVRYDVRLLDQRGEVVEDPVEGEADEIRVLRPGARAAIGATIHTDGQAVAVEARPTSVAWWPTDHPLVRFPAVVVADVGTARTALGAYGVSFSLRSDYPGQLRRVHPIVIFRDAAGAIVGGEWGFPVDVTPGVSYAEVDGMTLPPGADDARTEVFL